MRGLTFDIAHMLAGGLVLVFSLGVVLYLGVDMGYFWAVVAGLIAGLWSRMPERTADEKSSTKSLRCGR